jgi:hypothetical protein
MKIYKVEQKYFDSGRTEASVVETSGDSLPKSEHESRRLCDYYADYFLDRAAAERFAEDARRS